MKFSNALSKLLNQSRSLNKTLYPIKTIVICDPGVDDLLMLLQILHSSQYQIEGIIPVEGNTTCYQATNNTINLCELLGKTNIGIYPGAGYDKNAPSQSEETAVYGKNGLCYLILTEAKNMQVSELNGVEYAVGVLKQSKYMLISSATLTEPGKILKKLEREDPNALKNIIAISMMGGVINHTQEANWPINGQRVSEANIGVDPIASKKVFDICAKYQIPIFLAPLDLTHSILASESDLCALKKINKTAAKLAVQLIENVPLHYQKRYHLGPDQRYRQPLHDVHATSCLLHPELYHGQWVTVAVDERLQPHQIRVEDNTQGNVFLLDMHYLYRSQYFDYFAKDLR